LTYAHDELSLPALAQPRKIVPAEPRVDVAPDRRRKLQSARVGAAVATHVREIGQATVPEDAPRPRGPQRAGDDMTQLERRWNREAVASRSRSPTARSTVGTSVSYPSLDTVYELAYKVRSRKT
jgi:hypothetical protein